MLRPFAHPVAFCWMLLCKVLNRSNFSANNSQHFFCSVIAEGSTTMLDPFAQLFQHCWGHARSLRMLYKHLWVVSFPRSTVGPNIVGSCCIPLHTTANTDATTPNINSATMLGDVASVCMQGVLEGVLHVGSFASVLHAEVLELTRQLVKTSQLCSRFSSTTIILSNLPSTNH